MMWAAGAPWWFRLATIVGLAGGTYGTVYFALTWWTMRVRRLRTWVTIDE